MEGSHESSLKTLQDIRSIMERSARFISLSGWSGIWAGITGLAGSYIAWQWLKKLPEGYYGPFADASLMIGDHDYNSVVMKFFWLAVVVLLVAMAGAWYFTWRKTRLQGVRD